MPPRPFGRTLDARKSRRALPANPDYNAPPLTVECLVRLDSAKNFNILVASEPKESATHWELYTHADSGVLSAYLPGYAPSEVRSATVVADGRWHHCAMTFDGRIVRLYADGKEVASERVHRLSGVSPVAGPLCVGHIAGTGLGCDGELDEVRVSSVIRSITGIPEGPFEDDQYTLALWHFDPSFAGAGSSALADPFRAGAEAGLQARKALGCGEASAVIVFDSLEGDAEARRRMMEGIGWFFDTSLVFGCNGFGPITRGKAVSTVGVLALGEAISTVAAMAEVGGDHRACGKALGATLRKAPLAKGGQARIVLLLGDCHVPANDALTQGFLDGYGAAIPVVGGSCPQGGFVYHQGAVKQGINSALLLGGSFSVHTALGNAASAADVASSAHEIAERACSSGHSDLLLLFDCVSRKQALGDRVASELEAIEQAVPSGTLFGFYGSGEIGSDGVASAPKGVGGHLAAASLTVG